MEPSYQVLTIDVGFCSGTIPPEKIEALANSMGGKGYKLQNVLIDVRSTIGPFCPKRCAMLVFVKV